MASSALMTVDRQYFYHSFQDGLQFTLNAAMSKDNHYTLFRYEDWPAWVTFTTVFAVLIVFDNYVLNRNPQSLTISRAAAYVLFWIACACGFCGWVYTYYGEQQAFMWMSGYMLEWMLSFDNLFVFHLIFSVYGTPDHLKHRPLYLGIIGAVFFRLVFIFVGEYLMHAMFFMHFIFGAFLIYSGGKMLSVDDEDEDPSRHPLVQFLQKRVPFVSVYDERGAFFVKVPVNENGEEALPEGCLNKVGPPGESDSILNAEAGSPQMKYGTVDFAAAIKVPEGATPRRSQKQGKTRATMLFLVVLCLEISDVLFAVDSVSAIVAQVNDLFLAYTSAVFAMLGLRATFFIIDVLVQLFSLLKYGVAAVLVFIGIKLCIERVYHIPPGIVCAVLVTALASSMVASLVQDELKKKMEGKAPSTSADKRNLHQTLKWQTLSPPLSRRSRPSLLRTRRRPLLRLRPPPPRLLGRRLPPRPRLRPLRLPRPRAKPRPPRSRQPSSGDTNNKYNMHFSYIRKMS